MSLEQQLTDAIAAQNALTQAVANWKERMDASVAAQQAAFEAWRKTLVETINGVDVSSVGNLKMFTRACYINEGGYPNCLTNPAPPSYVRLLDFDGNGGSPAFFEVDVYKTHRGMGGSDYAEYVRFRGTCWEDGIGGIVKRTVISGSGSNRISLYVSDVSNVNQSITLPAGVETPFTVRQINNSNFDKRYSLIAKVMPLCGAGECLAMSAKYSGSQPRPAVTFVSQTRPEFPNL